MSKQELPNQRGRVVLREVVRRVVVEVHQGVEAGSVIVGDEEAAEAEGAAVALEVEGEGDEVQEPTRTFRAEGVDFEEEVPEEIIFHVCGVHTAFM